VPYPGAVIGKSAAVRKPAPWRVHVGELKNRHAARRVTFAFQQGIIGRSFCVWKNTPLNESYVVEL
jgi:hypothetical protein